MFYKLTHFYDLISSNAVYLESELLPDVVKKLVAYIEFEASDIDSSYGMNQEEVARVLTQYYDFRLVTEIKLTAFEIDLYLNWEEHCGQDLSSITEYHRNGLRETLMEVIAQSN